MQPNFKKYLSMKMHFYHHRFMMKKSLTPQSNLNLILLLRFNVSRVACDSPLIFNLYPDLLFIISLISFSSKFFSLRKKFIVSSASFTPRHSVHPINETKKIFFFTLFAFNIKRSVSSRAKQWNYDNDEDIFCFVNLFITILFLPRCDVSVKYFKQNPAWRLRWYDAYAVGKSYSGKLKNSLAAILRFLPLMI